MGISYLTGIPYSIEWWYYKIGIKKMKGITYRLPVRTERQMAHAERRQREAYSRYNNVQVIPEGMDYVRIVCTNERTRGTAEIALG